MNLFLINLPVHSISAAKVNLHFSGYLSENLPLLSLHSNDDEIPYLRVRERNPKESTIKLVLTNKGGKHREVKKEN